MINFLHLCRPGGSVTVAEVELGGVVVTKAVVVVVEDTDGTDVGRGTKKRKSCELFLLK